MELRLHPEGRGDPRMGTAGGGYKACVRESHFISLSAAFPTIKRKCFLLTA